MAASLSTKKQSALVFDEAETSALSRWEALAADIAIATEESNAKRFDYSDATGNAQARSWMAKLRKLKGRIEKARKEAKAPYLERGKAVDETAKTLEKAVQGLIEPHEHQIQAIEAEERARIEAHRAVLDRITRLAEGVTSTAEAHARLVELSAIDITLLEEFQSAGLNRQQEAGARLKELWDALLIQEAERAELQALRAEKAKQEAAEALEYRRALSKTAPVVSEAIACSAPEPGPTAIPAKIADESAWLDTSTPAECVRSGGAWVRADRTAQGEGLAEELFSRLAGMGLGEIIALIVGGNLHKAISVDWSKVELPETEEVSW